MLSTDFAKARDALIKANIPMQGLVIYYDGVKIEEDFAKYFPEEAEKFSRDIYMV